MSGQAQILGKRKRRDKVFNTIDEGAKSGEESASKLQALFREHFEASFEPLDDFCQPPSKQEAIESASDGIESEWEGISDGEQVMAHVIQYKGAEMSKPNISSDEFKTFMTSKPPKLSGPSKVRLKQLKEAESEEVISDAENLKKDFALQRLLKESHLLDPQSSFSPYGQNRHKSMDLRLQELGTKSSLYHQRNMPMSQRKGIAAKAAGREENRRKEAKENGIILEKVAKGKKGNDAKRQSGIGAPSVGKFKGGMLMLSKKDVVEIQGRKKTLKGRK